MAKKIRGKENVFSDDQEAEIVNQPITDTIEKNYMPYVMSVIISRAIPEIDGFKPSHRKLLYTMYKMGLMSGPRVKSTNVVGQTMKLNPHGDASIYETLVRLTRGNEALLHPFIDSKGSFGKQYSRDMAYAAGRYTEVKLDSFCAELFRGIDKNAVDMVDNYDNLMKEPKLLPTSFPNVLVSPNLGIAVGMASSICSFNLGEICDGTIELLRNPKADIEKILDIIKAPDFSTGASIIYSREQLKQVYETGIGSIKMRSRYVYDQNSNCIEIKEIPYSTTIELIMKRITDLIKEGKLKEITDFRDEIDLSGFKLTIDLRRGIDPDKLMTKLFKMTPLEDSFSCNFNILINDSPRQMGIIEILNEWIKFRLTCFTREMTFDLAQKKDKLHLLLGLGKILLDIDKAIKIVRETKSETDVVPNLMEGFDIDELQANFIADIKLRNLNREYISNRIKDIEDLQKEISNIEAILSDENKQKKIIAEQLTEIKKKYGKPRKTLLIYEDDIEIYDEAEDVDNYNVKLILTKEGYFKKITLVSLRANDEQKLKEGDELRVCWEGENIDELLFFSDKGQVYKARASDFDCVKASSLGDYLPAKLGFDEDEKVIYMKNISKYNDSDNFIFIFENGKGVRVPANTYETKTNRKKLSNAYSTISPIADVLFEDKAKDLLIISNMDRAIIINSELIPLKATRTSQGAILFKVKGKQFIKRVLDNFDDKIAEPKKYIKTKIPASGTLLDEKNPDLLQITIE